MKSEAEEMRSTRLANKRYFKERDRCEAMRNDLNRLQIELQLTKQKLNSYEDWIRRVLEIGAGAIKLKSDELFKPFFGNPK